MDQDLKSGNTKLLEETLEKNFVALESAKIS